MWSDSSQLTDDLARGPRIATHSPRLATHHPPPTTLHPPPAAHHPAVVCRGVTKEFGAGETRTWALRGVDLEVQPGQMTLLVGPSGCGKTTLISIIAGLLNPTAGDVAVLGADLGRLS